MTQYPVISAGTDLTAQLLNHMLPLVAVKGSDQSVTSSTALVNDTALVLAVEANAAYEFECYLRFEGGTLGSSDLQVGWTIPAGGFLTYGVSGIGSGGATLEGIEYTDTSATAHLGTGGAGTVKTAILRGSLSVSSTAGNLQMQWAQLTSNATPTIVHTWSRLRLRRVS